MNIRATGYGSVYESGYRFRRGTEAGVFLLVHAKTRISFRFGGRKAVLPEDTLIIYDGTREVDYAAEDDFLVCNWVVFDAEGDSEFFEPLELVFNLPLRFTDTDFIDSLMRNITSEFYSMNSHRLKMTDVMLKTLLLKVDEQCRPREISQSSAVEPREDIPQPAEKVECRPHGGGRQYVEVLLPARLPRDIRCLVHDRRHQR